MNVELFDGLERVFQNLILALDDEDSRAIMDAALQIEKYLTTIELPSTGSQIWTKDQKLAELGEVIETVQTKIKKMTNRTVNATIG